MSEEKIPIQDFQKLDLRVGKILEIEDHPKADKLYVLKVDIKESQPRQIIAGLKPYYKKDELVNKKAIFITNLQPAILRGIESNGMILAADNGEGKVICLGLEKDIEVGSKIR